MQSPWIVSDPYNNYPSPPEWPQVQHTHQTQSQTNVLNRKKLNLKNIHNNSNNNNQNNNELLPKPHIEINELINFSGNRYTIDGKRQDCLLYDTIIPCASNCNCMKSVDKKERLTNIWTDMEKLIFVDKFLQFPKNFYKISKFLINKTTKDCIKFYYDSKSTIFYKHLLKEIDNRKKNLKIQWSYTIKTASSINSGIYPIKLSNDKEMLIQLPNDDQTYVSYLNQPLYNALANGKSKQPLSKIYIPPFPRNETVIAAEKTFNNYYNYANKRKYDQINNSHDNYDDDDEDEQQHIKQLLTFKGGLLKNNDGLFQTNDCFNEETNNNDDDDYMLSDHSNNRIGVKTAKRNAKTKNKQENIDAMTTTPIIATTHINVNIPTSILKIIPRSRLPSTKNYSRQPFLTSSTSTSTLASNSDINPTIDNQNNTLSTSIFPTTSTTITNAPKPTNNITNSNSYDATVFFPTDKTKVYKKKLLPIKPTSATTGPTMTGSQIKQMTNNVRTNTNTSFPMKTASTLVRSSMKPIITTIDPKPKVAVISSYVHKNIQPMTNRALLMKPNTTTTNTNSHTNNSKPVVITTNMPKVTSNSFSRTARPYETKIIIPPAVVSTATTTPSNIVVIDKSFIMDEIINESTNEMEAEKAMNEVIEMITVEDTNDTPHILIEKIDIVINDEKEQ